MFELPREIRSAPPGRFQWSMTTTNVRNWRTSGKQRPKPAVGTSDCFGPGPPSERLGKRMICSTIQNASAACKPGLDHDSGRADRSGQPAPARGAGDHRLNMGLRPGLCYGGGAGVMSRPLPAVINALTILTCTP